MVDIISHRILPTQYIWFKYSAMNNAKLTETLRYGMLEVQEHIENFYDKKDQATMVSLIPI